MNANVIAKEEKNRLEAVKRYEEIIERIDGDISQAKQYAEDLKSRYDKDSKDIAETISLQSMVLKIQDYVSQKYMTRVELERQLLDLKK